MQSQRISASQSSRRAIACMLRFYHVLHNVELGGVASLPTAYNYQLLAASMEAPWNMALAQHCRLLEVIDDRVAAEV